MNYPVLQKIIFYFTLAYYKLFSFLECQNYRRKIFINEFIYLFCMLGFRNFETDTNKIILIKTKFGKFYIRDINIDIHIASPSYERQDINELVRQIDSSLILNHKVVFLDIGAFFGKYIVVIGNVFKKYGDKLKIIAFEPDTENYDLLRKNITLNRLSNVTAYQKALSNKKSIKRFFYYSPMKQIVSFPTSKKILIHTHILDDCITESIITKDTDLYIKLDVEGHEVQVLKGAKHVIDLSGNTTLLIEDAGGSQTKLIQFLSTIGMFLHKKTQINSFWKLK
jgi:FkbM family methyltransferase